MLQSDKLPLAEVIDSDQWQEIFDAHEIDFGVDEDSIYTPAITLWALISQTFFKGEMRSCKAAVGRVAGLWATLGKTVCSTNTGAYCRARAKISWQAIRDICQQVAQSTEATFDVQGFDPEVKQHPVVAKAQSAAKPRPKGRPRLSHHSRSEPDFHGHRHACRSDARPLLRQAKRRNGIALEDARSTPARRYAGRRLLPLHLLDCRRLQSPASQHRHEESRQET